MLKLSIESIGLDYTDPDLLVDLDVFYWLIHIIKTLHDVISIEILYCCNEIVISFVDYVTEVTEINKGLGKVTALLLFLLICTRWSLVGQEEEDERGNTVERENTMSLYLFADVKASIQETEVILQCSILKMNFRYCRNQNYGF